MVDILKSLRSRRGMRVDDVAEALGLDRSTIYTWEKGDKRPDPEHLGRLLDLYDATDAERLEIWRLRSLPRDGAAAA